jgi:hypothetical protein
MSHFGPPRTGPRLLMLEGTGQIFFLATRDGKCFVRAHLIEGTLAGLNSRFYLDRHAR